MMSTRTMWDDAVIDVIGLSLTASKYDQLFRRLPSL